MTMLLQPPPLSQISPPTPPTLHPPYDNHIPICLQRVQHIEKSPKLHWPQMTTVGMMYFTPTCIVSDTNPHQFNTARHLWHWNSLSWVDVTYSIYCVPLYLCDMLLCVFLSVGSKFSGVSCVYFTVYAIFNANLLQEAEWVVGRVVCEAEGSTLNAKSILLEGGRESSHGARVRLDVAALPSYHLFPGQACQFNIFGDHEAFSIACQPQPPLHSALSCT